MNYGIFLEENNHFEEAFKAYEKGVALFKWPHVYDIWNTYLMKFIKRYVRMKILFNFNTKQFTFCHFLKGGKKLERVRDLFEQCLESCPPEFAKSE